MEMDEMLSCYQPEVQPAEGVALDMNPANVNREKAVENFANLEEALRANDAGKRLSTLELSDLAKECQGPYECEFFFEEGSDLLEHYKACKKNPGHTNFTPYEKLNLLSLPEGYRHEEVLEVIHLQAALTVKIKSRYISENRPDIHPRTGQPYTYKTLKGKTVIRVGTGTVLRVEEVKLKDERFCQCSECMSSGTRRSSHFAVVIITALHVVFDQAEADQTDVTFSFHTDDGSKVTRNLGSNCTHLEINGDNCSLNFITHDALLATRLQTYRDQFMEKLYSAAKLFDKDESGAMLAIVSHPHGCEKQVSFGHVVSKVPLKENKYLESSKPTPLFVLLSDMFRSSTWYHGLAYNTPTCPGSSGAVIVHFKKNEEDNFSVHEGHNENDSTNFSGDDRHVHFESDHHPEGCKPLELHMWRKWLQPVRVDVPVRGRISRAFKRMKLDVNDLLRLAEKATGPNKEEQLSELISLAKRFDAALCCQDVSVIRRLAFYLLANPLALELALILVSTAESEETVDIQDQG